MIFEPYCRVVLLSNYIIFWYPKFIIVKAVISFFSPQDSTLVLH